MSPGILVIDDEVGLAKNIKTYLARYDFDVRVMHTGRDGIAEYEQFKPDVVLLDFKLPDLDGIEVLNRINNLDPCAKVVMMTGEGSVEVAVNAMKSGAADYLSKPLVLSELKLTLERIHGQQKLEGALNYYHQRAATDSGVAKLLGESTPIHDLKARIMQLVQADRQLTSGAPATVLITGETGTGKELVARAIHFDGPRAAQPFVEVNCAAIPGNLLEAELFGYERGAFTDAHQRKLGLVESADGGTLFLDEIGELELNVQTKLLKLLEDRSLRRLGSVRDRQVDVRIISATNQQLEQRVAEGRFRSDLYFRLRVLEMQLPPLRKRGDDIIDLAEQFLAQHGLRYGKPGLFLSEESKHILRRHSWPGNVRELRNTMEQIVLLANSREINADQLPVRASETPAQQKTYKLDRHFELPDEGLDLKALEHHLLEQALHKTEGNVTRAARLLGLTRDTLRYRLDKMQERSAS